MKSNIHHAKHIGLTFLHLRLVYFAFV